MTTITVPHLKSALDSAQKTFDVAWDASAAAHKASSDVAYMPKEMREDKSPEGLAASEAWWDHREELQRAAMLADKAADAARTTLATAKYNASPVGMLLGEIQKLAESKSLTVSRWQTNKGNHACIVSYAVHSGGRAVQARHQSGVVASCSFSGLEGSTSRCQAYADLSAMLRELQCA
jgi:hypothetical protein